MDNWLWALLLKPLVFLAMAAAYYVFIYRGTQWLGRLFPDGKLKDFLFRERGNARASASTELHKRVDHDRTV